MGKKYSHLTWNDRLHIEKLLLSGYRPAEIARIIGCCRATIYNEIKRATYKHTDQHLIDHDRYNPDGSQKKYNDNLKKKGVGLKGLQDPALLDYIEYKIVEKKYSPAAAIMSLKEEEHTFKIEILSHTTIYKYIKRGIFKNIKQEHSIVKKKVKKKKVVRAKKRTAGKSIEKRPEEIDLRHLFGHWEMDTVIGKATNEKSLLVFTERKTRKEIIEILKKHTAEETVKALNRVEKRFGSSFYKVFKSITVDNGSEFADSAGMEKALYRIGNRTNIYYCHAYSSFERGTNENQNKLIRRHYPKGSDFDKVLNKREVKEVEEWINNYPRRLFDGKTSERLFEEECKKLVAG